MEIWARAFTHETVSAANNYEKLEFAGDAMLKAVFPKYIMKRFPNFEELEYTELNTQFMSKVIQAEMARKLEMTEYIRIRGIDKALLKIETDVFESFFGALDTISDNLVPGLGYSNCYNMIIYLFKNVEFKLTGKRERGALKTQVQQIFQRFALPKPEEIIKQTDDYGVMITVRLLPEHMEFLRKNGINIGNPVIGAYAAYTKKEASQEVYDMAYDTLVKYGVTTPWAEETKLQQDLNNEQIKRILPKAKQRLSKEGYEKMTFYIPRKLSTPKGAVVELIGVRPNKTKEILGLIYTNDKKDIKSGYFAAKAELIEKYGNGVKF
jgi:dsRNA-specific ribonuclease